jgi:hypothetical protein
MATTTNYGWTTPDDTALVKDGASAIRSLGTSVDTTTKNLNPSTTLGDIEYRSSTANTNTRLGIGSTGNVLTVVGGVPAWSAPAGGGKVLQVVQGTKTSNASTSSATFVDVGLSVSITPSSATSKVFIIANLQNCDAYDSGNVTELIGSFQLLRSSTVLKSGGNGLNNFPTGTNKTLFYQINFNYLDDPNTTSATTYKVQFKKSTASGTLSIGANASATDIMSITAMEIGA